MSTDEHWLPVVGFEGAYEVSNLGRVRSLNRVIQRRDGRGMAVSGQILAPQATSRGAHLSVALSKGTRRYVHVLVLEAFVGPRPAGMEGCHGPAGVMDNRPCNLRWDSHRENMQDSLRHGTNSFANRAHCPRGHELVAPNLVLSVLRRGKRSCLACNRARDYLRTHPTEDLQVVSDRYYSEIKAIEIEGVESTCESRGSSSS